MPARNRRTPPPQEPSDSTDATVEATSSPAPAAAPDPAPAPDPANATVSAGARRFLVARQDGPLPAGFSPLSADDLLQQLKQDKAVKVEKVITPQSLAVLADTPGSLQQVIVATISDDKVEELRQHPQVLVEEDALLQVQPVTPPSAVGLQDPAMFIPFGGSTTWRLRVTGADGTPVAGATAFLYGSGVPAQGRTNADGIVELSLLNESDATLRALYVNPQATYWNLWLNRPQLSSAVLNNVTLTPLAATLTGLPDTQILGWGQRTMRVDRLDAGVTGAGVKVAVIDSGAATTHHDLADVHKGRDLTADPPDNTTWNDDEIAHGSHCSGVIAGRNDAAGIRGFAPGAEVHALRIFPGGRFSSLLEALDYCIEQGIDVANMSLGSGASSDLMRQKLAQAKQAGVACIVAAGNSGGDVQFPGSIEGDVLTVAAIGKLGEFPPNTYHAQQVAGATDNGYFSAAFSCHGPSVDVCAPGVAIVSSVPPDDYAAWDGTSMATPHVTGLAALVLAHHPDFRVTYARHDAARVDRLFAIIKASATPLNLGDSGRTGAGVPDAVRALSGQPGAAGTDGPGTPGLDAVAMALEELRRDFATAGLL
jgi:subtilisin